MQELPNEPYEHKTECSKANLQPQPQLSTQVDSDSIHLDLDKKETYERLEKFITTFVTEFTKTLNKYKDETSLKTNTAAENVVEETTAKVIEEILTRWASIAVHPIIVSAKYVSYRIHRKKAKRVVEVFRPIQEYELANMLAEAGGNIFYNYQSEFNMVTDTNKYWARAMEKLAIDAKKRVINYVNQYKQDNPDMDVSVDLITEGVELGKSRQSFIITAMQKIPKMPKLGHTIKICNKKYKTSEVYENLVKKGDGIAGKYYSKKGNGSNSRKSKDTSGLTQISNEDCQEVIEQREEEHKYILSLEEAIEKAKETLNKINEEDNLFLQKSMMNEIKNLSKRIDKMDGRPSIPESIPESKQVRKPIYYNMKPPVASFTGRGKELKCLHKKLQKGDKRVLISQMTVVTGLGGIGKTELVRKYAMEYAKHYDNNVIWIDSEKHESLTTSFKELAEKELKLISEKIDGDMQEKQVNSIVKDVYVHFINVKSLFIFDNAEEYRVIEKFLPTSLHLNAQRPYILITSRNRNWDVDDEGQIHVMQLDVFTQKEATMFIKNSIKIKDGLQKGDIEKLTKRLQYFPLALRQAIVYINQEDEMFSRRWSKRFKISDYLKKLDENTKLLNEGYYKISDRYSRTVLKTWLTTLEKIKEDQNHGTKAIAILNVMAYLAPDKIHASKMFDCDSVELCDKYSMIDLKKGGVASIHRLVQEVIRLMLKDKNKEEEVIQEALTLIGNNENTFKENTSHVTSVWSYASGYSKLIHEFYFNFNSIPTYGYNNATPLHLLAENGSDKAVEAILDKAILMKETCSEKFSEIIDAKDKYNRTPLYMAVENGHASVVKLFVDKQAKIDIKSTIVYNSLSTKKASDWTLLHVAAFNGYSDIVEILVNKDETLVDIEDSIGRTAAVLAACSGQINVLEILKPEPYNVYLLHAKFRAARKSGNLEDVKNFLKYLEEKHQLQDIINVKLGEWAPLHLAACANWLNIIKILITNGAKVKDTTPSFTPLHSASSNGHLAVIKYLIEKGAHPKDINKDGWTSLHAAAQNGHLHVVKYFIDELKEIDVDIIDNACATPLHTAAFHGKLNVVKFLLRRGANIKAVNILGATPLFTAAINNNRDVFDFLLNEDATVVNTSDDQTLLGRLNISVLHVAAVYNDKQMIEDLINRGVDKDIGKDTSLTPLYFATFFDSLEATNYLITSGAATNVRINISIIREVLEKTVTDSTLKPSSMPKFVSTLINFVNILPDKGIEVSANDLKSVIEKLCSLFPNFGQLIDSLKIYVEQRKNPDLDLPLHGVFFTQEVGINSKDGDE